ncbi:S9 family peptidase [Pelagibius sp.]|uniref:alpha/beta hydrolase family protein n=1 Tax=Pelagibius sp. TaxID=1931238 RepID=UPI0026095757|nr:prolyl oligopeptidase family serine peptidase [Pelagibius sp.]
MRALVMAAFAAAFAATAYQEAAATPCAADNRSRVAANDECLVISTYGEPAERTALILFIHGDGYRGGPSDYLYPIAEELGTKGVVAVGLIRPGYYDSKDNRSTGNSYRRGDNYRPDVIATVAAAVKVLKEHTRADYVVLAGHSGGAAISGVIIGKHPDLVDAAVLAACPCNVPEWRIKRRGRNSWRQSLSPHSFVDGVDETTTVVAVTGGNDRNTEPVLARDYVADLKTRGIDASFLEVPGAGHNGVVRTPEFLAAIAEVLARRP